MGDVEDQPVPPVSVLMVVDDDVFDRLGGVVRHLCVGMLDEAVRLTVLSWTARRVADEAVGPARMVHVEGTGRSWAWRGPRGEAVLQLIGGDRPQVVHALSVGLAQRVRAWADEWRSALVVHVTDLIDVEALGRLEPVDRTLLVATTNGLKRAVQETHPQRDLATRVILLGMPAEAEPVCLTRPGGIPSAVMTTPLTRDCGLEVVLKALRAVVKAGHEVHLFILAGGPAERGFRRQVEQLGLRGHVTFAGRLGDWTTLREAMRGADFYVLTSTRRRFTISTLMAMANGLAVLAPTGTVGDYLIDGETASLFEPQDARGLGERWTALLADQDAARRLAQGALDHIRTHHQASAMAQAVAGVYRDLHESGFPVAGAGSGAPGVRCEP